MWICVPHWLNNQQQKDFFAYAQKALQRTDSCYYSLIHRLLDSVDEDRICTVGVNMGFGGLIYGASELKKQADLEGQPIAWITAARCGDERLSELVPKAARHGSFVWLLDATDTDPAQVVLLAKANPQSAFGLLADPSALTEDCVKTLAACRNLVVMPLLQTPELTPEVCRAARRLKAQKMFYVLTVLIDDETAGEVMQDDWLESMAQETLCCMCARKPGTSDETARKLRRSIVNGRLETGKPVLLLDWDGDVRYLNNRISEYTDLRQRPAGGQHLPFAVGLTSWPPLRGGSRRSGWGREPYASSKYFGLWQNSLPPALRAASLAGGQVLPHKMTKTDPVPML